MYEELICKLRNNAEFLEIASLHQTPADGFAATMREAADAIEELSVVVRSQKAVLEKFPRWIPVTEQLPPAEKEVYVTDGEYIARANLLDEVFPGDKPCWSYSGLEEITHWCKQIPFPKQPKEENE